MAQEPKWRRRKTARPAEIVAAALVVFGEKGFAAARLDEIALRAGVSKGALYLYFSDKEALFRAAVREAVSPNIEAVAAMVGAYHGPFGDLIRMLLPRVAHMATTTQVGAVLKMVVGESRNFPELAQVWHDEVVAKAVGAVSALIEKRQAAGELRPGDPRLHAFSIIGPMLVGVLWRETFTPVGGAEIDLQALARQHAETVLAGLLNPEAS